ncbi:conserved hypothetical protein [Roseovarius sp. EC-HK134]|nr:conserved hypothetical protein [Roseovarius sp. EC-HK134]VVT08651.1 conserved hypothetical protein [Roseovarius sp. EC-SD190]
MQAVLRPVKEDCDRFLAIRGILSAGLGGGSPNIMWINAVTAPYHVVGR